MGEIENVLRTHPAVQEAVALMREYVPGDRRLSGYVMPKYPEDSVEADDLFRLPNGLELVHFHAYETELLYKEIFEEETYLKHGIRLSDGACVFDVGANIGMFSLYVHGRCRNARVFAFEPSPPTFQKLQINAALYGLEIKAFNYGLSNETKGLELKFYPEMTGMSGVYADPLADEQLVRATMRGRYAALTAHAQQLLAGKFQPETYACEFKRLSDVLREENIQQIDLLKIDAEKSETDILDGIDSADWRKIQQIVVEVHDLDGRLGQVKELLQRQGYEIFVTEESFLEGTGLLNVYATRFGSQPQAIKAKAERPLNLRRQPGQLSGALRDYLKERLPEYMVPSDILLLEQFPLTRNGKIDRKALQAVERKRPTQEEKYVEPRTSTEKRLAEIWAKVLKLDGVGLNDDFFDLGGHSLLATQVVAQVRDTFGIEIPLRMAFQSSRLGALAEYIETVQWATRSQNTAAEENQIQGDV